MSHYGICKSCKHERPIYSGGYCRPCYKYNVNLCVKSSTKVKGKVRPSIMHVYIHPKLKDNCDFNNGELRRDVVRIIFLRSHIPNICHNDFLCEMEELGMIRSKDKRNIEIVI